MRIVGNARTKGSLIGETCIVKRAVGLGGWHWLQVGPLVDASSKQALVKGAAGAPRAACRLCAPPPATCSLAALRPAAARFPSPDRPACQSGGYRSCSGLPPRPEGCLPRRRCCARGRRSSCNATPWRCWSAPPPTNRQVAVGSAASQPGAILVSPAALAQRLVAHRSCLAVMLQDMSEEEEEELRRQQQQQQQQLAVRGYPYEPAEPHAEGKPPSGARGAAIPASIAHHCVIMVFAAACAARKNLDMPAALFLADRPRPPRRPSSVPPQPRQDDQLGRTRLHSARGAVQPRINLSKLQTTSLKRYGAVYHLVSRRTADTAAAIPIWMHALSWLRAVAIQGLSRTQPPLRQLALAVSTAAAAVAAPGAAPRAVQTSCAPSPAAACLRPGIARSAAGRRVRALCLAASGRGRGHCLLPVGHQAAPHGPAAMTGPSSPPTRLPHKRNHHPDPAFSCRVALPRRPEPILLLQGPRGAALSVALPPCAFPWVPSL